MTSVNLANEACTLALGRGLARSIQCPFVLFLKGDLGVGKTTLMRGLILEMGHQGAVKSPTYGLAETYDTPIGQCIHLDLYRIADPEELEYLGVLDELSADTLLAVEWPENGRGALPAPDLVIKMAHLRNGRSAEFRSLTPQGERVCRTILNFDIKNGLEVQEN